MLEEVPFQITDWQKPIVLISGLPGLLS